MSFEPAPILLFVYNRPVHTRRALAALAANALAAESNLVIVSDGPRGTPDCGKVEEVRTLCREVSGFRSLRMVEREENAGLAASILQGVGEVLESREKVIVLEDDLLTHPAFLRYMNGALDAYASHESILSVSAYLPGRLRMPRPKFSKHDVWLNPRNLSFGWGTWSGKWASVDWEQARKDGFAERADLQAGFAEGGADLSGMLKDQLAGRLDSWAVRFSYAHYRSGRFSLMPVESYVKPIGFDGSGVHCRPNPARWFESTRWAVKNPKFPEHPEADPDLVRALRKHFDRHHRLAKWLGM